MATEQHHRPEQTPSLAESVQEPPRKPALGSPHDGYAAVLLTLALTIICFSFATGRLLTEAHEQLWWLPVALLAVLAPGLWFALKYFFRAHGLQERGGFPALPAFAMYAAFFGLIMFVLPLLAGVSETWWIFALCCLVIATVVIAPVQLVLSKDPNRNSELTA